MNIKYISGALNFEPGELSFGNSSSILKSFLLGAKRCENVRFSVSLCRSDEDLGEEFLGWGIIFYFLFVGDVAPPDSGGKFSILGRKSYVCNFLYYNF